MTQDVEALAVRLERLEKRNRILTWLLASAALLVVSLLVNLYWSGLRIGKFESLQANSVTARRIVIREVSPHFTPTTALVIQDREGTDKLLLTNNELIMFDSPEVTCLHLRGTKDQSHLSFREFARLSGNPAEAHLYLKTPEGGEIYVLNRKGLSPQISLTDGKGKGKTVMVAP